MTGAGQPGGDGPGQAHRRITAWDVPTQGHVIVCSCGRMPPFPTDAWHPEPHRAAHAEHVAQAGAR